MLYNMTMEQLHSRYANQTNLTDRSHARFKDRLENILQAVTDEEAQTIEEQLEDLAKSRMTYQEFVGKDGVKQNLSELVENTCYRLGFCFTTASVMDERGRIQTTGASPSNSPPTDRGSRRETERRAANEPDETVEPVAISANRNDAVNEEEDNPDEEVTSATAEVDGTHNDSPGTEDGNEEDNVDDPEQEHAEDDDENEPAAAMIPQDASREQEAGRVTTPTIIGETEGNTGEAAIAANNDEGDVDSREAQPASKKMRLA